MLIKRMLLALIWCGAILGSPVEKYLEGRLSPQDKRYKTFQRVLELMQDRKAKVIVETGTSRFGELNFDETSGLTDGGSTIILAHWAADHRGLLYSVDIDGNALNQAAQATKSYKSSTNFVQRDSIAFLRNFIYKIDFLYLDSFDFDVRNAKPSQQHHLKEIIAAYPLLHEKTIVMIDDCDLPHGGKGKLAIAYLLDRGWKIIEDAYQVILVRG